MSDIYTKDGVRESHCQKWIRHEDHARVVAELRAALAKAEAERDAARGAMEMSDLILRDAARSVWGGKTAFGRDTPHLLAGEVLSLRSRLECAEAERDTQKARATELEDALDLAHDEFQRIEHLTNNAEIHGLCWRGRQSIRQNVHVIVQRDRAQTERDALKAQVERLAAECRAARQHDDVRKNRLADWLNLVCEQVNAARAAVDAAGDLEGTR